MITIDELKDKFKNLDKPTGTDFSSLIEIAFIGADNDEQVSTNTQDITNIKSSLTTIENNSSEAKDLADNANTNVSSLQEKMVSLENNVTSATGNFSGKVNTTDLPSQNPSNLADITLLANFKKGLQILGKNVATDDDVASAIDTLSTSLETKIKQSTEFIEIPKSSDLLKMVNLTNTIQYYKCTSLQNLQTLSNVPITNDSPFIFINYPVPGIGTPTVSYNRLLVFDMETNDIYTNNLTYNTISLDSDGKGTIIVGDWQLIGGKSFAVADNEADATTIVTNSKNPMVVFY